MASSVGKTQILHMYKSLLRESQKINNYNFKFYALRRVRDGFKDNKTLTDSKEIQKEYAYAQENLMVIQRQVTIGAMFSTEKLVIENQR